MIIRGSNREIHKERERKIMRIREIREWERRAKKKMWPREIERVQNASLRDKEWDKRLEVSENINEEK